MVISGIILNLVQFSKWEVNQDLTLCLLFKLCELKQPLLVLWIVARLSCRGGRRDACAKLFCYYIVCDLCLWSVAGIPALDELVPPTTKFCDVPWFTQKRKESKWSLPKEIGKWNVSWFPGKQLDKILLALYPVLVIWQPNRNMDLFSNT
jgi:hypothetical protein